MLLAEDCTFYSLNHIDLKKVSFNCNNEDLNDFFFNDSLKYAKALLGKTYCFVENTSNPDEKQIVSFFTIANDSLKTHNLPNSRKKKVETHISREKILRSYPAILIGRLGVNIHCKAKRQENTPSIGDQTLDFIKEWFLDTNNKSGCRFILVDAYNDIDVCKFYERNGFGFVFSTEIQEKEHFEITDPRPLRTRLMFYDLINHRNNIKEKVLRDFYIQQVEKEADKYPIGDHLLNEHLRTPYK